ncbi:MULTISPECIES: alpha/beta fold hydrolase [Streptomyces]|nr:MULTISPECIES: alpha/beta fold hydrolase [Streptomyces]MYT09021.1 alpha/beta fold hydrolase [Streptomyces sp. SID5470]
MTPSSPTTPPDALDAARRGNITSGTVRGPRDAVELAVWGAWREHFDTARVTLDADYFALGGDSVGAVSLLARIRERTGVQLPLDAILRAPTVEAMAALARTGARAEQVPATSLVTILGGERRPVLVCVHPIGGTVLWYRHLADALPKGVATLGLQARGLNPALTADPDIPAMARRYIADTVAAAYAPGDVVLVGYSFGGLVAHEMACQLADAGTPAAGVLLLDTPATTSLEEPPSRARLLWSLVGHALGLDVDVEELAALDPQEQAERILRLATRHGTLPPGFGTDRLTRLIGIYQINADAAYAYRPGVHPGRTDLIRPREGRTDEEDLAIWKRSSLGGVAVHDVPGDHFNLIAEENVGHVADVVQRLWYDDERPPGAGAPGR